MRTAVLISGRGSNLQAILEAEEEKNLGDANVVLVISNNSEAKGVILASNYSKNIEILDIEEGEDTLIKILMKHEIELIVLAGFMKILSSDFVSRYVNKIINIHPSLLPSFPGLNAQRQALESGVKISGCTVHFVNEEVDDGPIILQSAVEVLDEDTEVDLASRILKEEHKILPNAISLVSQGKLDVVGRKVRIVK